MTACCGTRWSPVSDQVEAAAAAAVPIAAIHPDIVRAHILTCLDGLSLAASSCASAQLNALSSDDILWRDVCAATWPSTRDPLVRRAVSSFPSGHRSFFSDSYPLLHHPPKSSRQRLNYDRRPSPTAGLIFAVDIFYKDELVLSKVQSTETESGWFRFSPFRVDLLEPEESVAPASVIPRSSSESAEAEAEWFKQLEDNLKLSWIVIDPIINRAVNLSSRHAVSIRRHPLTGNVQVRYNTVVAGESQRGSAAEVVQFGTKVTFTAGKSKGGSGGEGLEVAEVSLLVEDMEGRNLNGRDSLVILRKAMEEGGRKRGERGSGEAKERFKEFKEMKRERKRRQNRTEMAVDLAWAASWAIIMVAFWSYILFR
ncbi:hypothetical protein SAY87_016248 [Trapa incisa]|uniref:F-box protein n=1 Tax=Trapa incisa TaxID=236973 RepID=A0AAN7LH10_9MYRT|nr:hypothetical protein SAY87_016248 [Trapa incisa]